MAEVTFPEDGGFSYDLSTNIGKVRYMSGDVRRGSALVADEEITFALEQNGDQLTYAAIEVLDLMESRLIGSDASSAGASSSRSQRLQAIRQYRDRLRHRVAAFRGPQVTGLKLSDRYMDDTSSFRPTFRVGQFDTPETD